jgi:hypothetical protein
MDLPVEHKSARRLPLGYTAAAAAAEMKMEMESVAQTPTMGESYEQILASPCAQDRVAAGEDPDLVPIHHFQPHPNLHLPSDAHIHDAHINYGPQQHSAPPSCRLRGRRHLHSPPSHLETTHDASVAVSADMEQRQQPHRRSSQNLLKKVQYLLGHARSGSR